MSHFLEVLLFKELIVADPCLSGQAGSLANGYRFPTFYQQLQIHHNDFVTLKSLIRRSDYVHYKQRKR